MASDNNMATVRELYEEFLVGNETVSMISDPENPNAWIQSNVTRAINP